MEKRSRESIWYFVFYFGVLLFALAWIHFPHVQRHAGVPRTDNIRYMYVVLAVAFCAVGLRAYLEHRGYVSSRLQNAWLAADLIVISLCVALTGGIRSEAALLYFWDIAAASIRHRPRRTLLVGLASAALYATATLLAWFVLVGRIDPAPQNGSELWSMLVTYGFVILLVTFVARSYAQEQAKRVEETAALRAEVRLADYQKSLSREMHDGIQHYLVRAATRLELAKLELATAPRKAAEMAIEERITVRQANQELRYLVHRLRSRVLDKLGFVEALRNHVVRFDQWSAISAHFRKQGTPTGLEPDVEQAALRILQEALTNAEKYSGANEVEVRLVFAPQQFACVIADDGVGFHPPDGDDGESPERVGGLNGGLGLASMRERASDVGGELAINSAQGEGTRIVFTVPLGDGARAEAGTEQGSA